MAAAVPRNRRMSRSLTPGHSHRATLNETEASHDDHAQPHIVPARDKVAAARFFARIFGLNFDGSSDHFAPVRVNETITLLFDEDPSPDSHHYAFHVSDGEFDAIFGRVKKEGIGYGSAP